MTTTLIKNTTLCLTDGLLKDGEVLIRGKKIVAVGRDLPVPKGTKIIDGRQKTLCPGFIDLHLHGGGGADVSDPSPSALGVIARAHAQNGVTGFLVSAYTEGTGQVQQMIRRFNRASLHPKDGAVILGYHLEGPYFNPSRRGMYRPEHCRPPKLTEVKELLKLSKGRLRHISMAPELPGAREAIRYLVESGVTVSVAHTEADYALVKRSAAWGASHATHLFNAMRGIHHREPGPVPAVLLDDRFTVEIIADGHHLHPAIVEMVLRIKGYEKVALVSDAMRAAGCKPGRYALGSFDTVTYRKDGTVRGEDGNLASTAISLNTAVVNLARFTRLPLWQAVVCASLVPARIIGCDDKKGSLEPGKDADLCLMDKTGRVDLTMIEGRIVHQARSKTSKTKR